MHTQKLRLTAKYCPPFSNPRCVYHQDLDLVDGKVSINLYMSKYHLGHRKDTKIRHNKCRVGILFWLESQIFLHLPVGIEILQTVIPYQLFGHSLSDIQIAK